MCLDAYSVPHAGVPQGITAYLAGECLQAFAGVNGLILVTLDRAFAETFNDRGHGYFLNSTWDMGRDA